MSIKYKSAKNVRFSCAYLFRIKIGEKYFLVKDEQGRNTYQPVGGVYKYFSEDVFNKMHALQCTRFGYCDDLDCDLRLIIPKKYVGKFKRWYSKEIQRETPANLYREFQEEIIDRISFIDSSVFKRITYKFCGRHIEVSKYGENNLQVHMSDIVELIPTPQQTKEFLSLQEKESDVYCFASKEEIYNLGCINGNQIPTISAHTRKILIEEAHTIKSTRRTGKKYTCSSSESQSKTVKPNLEFLVETNKSKPFTFISYNSLHSSEVWKFCNQNKNQLNNLWIDKKNVSENWAKDVEEALCSENCEKAIIFIDKQYLLRSTACYYEASLVSKKEVPHIIVLVDTNKKFIIDTIKIWINNDAADKDKLRVFKKLFNYDDDTGHINTSVYELNDANNSMIMQAFSNLHTANKP